jgi:hypothetical protein
MCEISVNPLGTGRYPFHLKTQFVLRSKHFTSRGYNMTGNIDYV